MTQIQQQHTMNGEIVMKTVTQSIVLTAAKAMFVQTHLTLKINVPKQTMIV
jgi:hypothetical protein